MKSQPTVFDTNPWQNKTKLNKTKKTYREHNKKNTEYSIGIWKQGENEFSVWTKEQWLNIEERFIEVQVKHKSIPGDEGESYYQPHCCRYVTMTRREAGSTLPFLTKMS